MPIAENNHPTWIQYSSNSSFSRVVYTKKNYARQHINQSLPLYLRLFWYEKKCNKHTYSSFVLILLPPGIPVKWGSLTSGASG